MSHKPNVVSMIFGSHLYGLNTELSDYDYKSIYIPKLMDVINGNAPPIVKQSTGPEDGKNAPGDVDDEIIHLSKFIHLAMNGDTMALDMLHANPTDISYNSEIWQDLQSKRSMFYTKNLSSLLGYVKTQASKYGIKGSRVAAMKLAIDHMSHLVKLHKELHGSDCHALIKNYWDGLPLNDFLQKVSMIDKKGVETHYYEICHKKYQDTASVQYILERVQCTYNSYGHRAQLAAANEGIDWKALSHALRAGYQARQIYTQNTMTFPIAEREFLLDVKLGKLDYMTVVAPALEKIVEEVSKLSELSTLPPECDRQYWSSWLQSWLKKVYQVDPDQCPDIKQWDTGN
jgi:predicted nucleotidyltransferase